MIGALYVGQQNSFGTTPYCFEPNKGSDCYEGSLTSDKGFNMTENEPFIKTIRSIKTIRLINPDGSTNTLPIGSPIRIRLPTEYILKNKIENYKMDDPVPINGEPLIDYTIADILYGFKTLFPGYKPIPLTRWQKIKRRFKNRIQDLKQRCKDIWTIVSGGDIHDNCDYY